MLGCTGGSVYPDVVRMGERLYKCTSLVLVICCLVSELGDHSLDKLFILTVCLFTVLCRHEDFDPKNAA